MTRKPTVLIVGEGLDEAHEIYAKLHAAGCEVCYAATFAEGVAFLESEFLSGRQASQLMLEWDWAAEPPIPEPTVYQTSKLNEFARSKEASYDPQTDRADRRRRP